MSDWVIVEGCDTPVYWPMCPVPGCSNRICLSLGSDRCWPHTGTGKDQKEFMSQFAEPSVIEE